MQDEGDRGAATAGADRTQGLHPNSYGVTVTTFGRASPIGRCTPLVVSEKTLPELRWTRIDIECLELAHTQALLVLQGLPLKKLFEGVRFFSPERVFEGTFTFLRGELSSHTDPPPRLLRVVLAGVSFLSQGVRDEDILGLLLRDVLPYPQP